MTTGRPLRFVGLVLCGWTTVRVAAITFPFAAPAPRMLAYAPPFALSGYRSGQAEPLQMPSSILLAFIREAGVQPKTATVDALRFAIAAPASLRPGLSAAITVKRGGGWSNAVADSMLAAQIAFAHTPRAGLALAAFAAGAGLSAQEGGLPIAPGIRADRWSGAAWILLRQDGGGAALARSERLGGSQAGVRLDYAMAPGSSLRPALYGRASGALGTPVGAEVAVGLALHPDIPVTFAMERRQAVSAGGRNDFAILAAGGLYARPIGAGLRLDGYGQAGFVGFSRRDGFVDGRLSIERSVAGPKDGELSVGATLSGGAQPGASRLDIGPQATLRLHAGAATMRLGAEWRQRVAGDARPSSGPALTLATDF